MLGANALLLLLFWGSWLLIPVVTDGLKMMSYLLVALLPGSRRTPLPLPTGDLPKVSVLIPAHNEQLNINYCLMGIKAQTYPHQLLEVIVVDDGSRDDTSNIVLKHMDPREHHPEGAQYLRTSSFTIGMQGFGGVINLVRRKRDPRTEHGKPAAINAGLSLASGDLIVAIDSDVVLEPHAIEYAVRQFLADDKLAAATGHLIIDPYLAFEVDAQDRARTDAYGLPISRSLSFSERLLTGCQFIEYATAFHLGRRSESLINGMFTLAGACAVFRREVFEEGATIRGYRGRTVSEDTDITMDLHHLPDHAIGYLSHMYVHLAPTLSWSALYSQRLRWQRGALEVSAVHMARTYAKNAQRLYWRILLPMRLMGDHTLVLPRLMWTFLIFLLPLFGYAWGIVGQALGLLMVFYLIVNMIQTLVAYVLSSPPEKVFIRRYLSYLPLLPLYNMFLFWTRTDANLVTLTEDAAWNVDNSLLTRLETINRKELAVRAARLFQSFM